METDDDLIKAYRFNSTTVNLLALLATRDRDAPRVSFAKAVARVVIDQMGVEKSARMINHVIECLQAQATITESLSPGDRAPKPSKSSTKTPEKLAAAGKNISRDLAAREVLSEASEAKASKERRNGNESFPYFEEARRLEFGNKPIYLKPADIDAQLSKQLRKMREAAIEQDQPSGIPKDLWKGKTYQRYRTHLKSIGLLAKRAQT